MTDDTVRRDFVAAYAQKWSVTPEYANGMLEHVEIGACEDALGSLYQQLCHMHMDALLQHGPGVAQGIALAVRTVAELIPSEKRHAAVTECAETTGENRP